MVKENTVAILQQNALILIDLHVKVKENQNVGQKELVNLLVHILKRNVPENAKTFQLVNLEEEKNAALNAENVLHSNILKLQKKS